MSLWAQCLPFVRSEFGQGVGMTAKYWQVRPSELMMITSFPNNLFFDMYMAEEISRIEKEQLDDAKKGKKPYVGDERKTDPEVQRQLDVFADRKPPIMDKHQIIQSRSRMNKYTR